MKTVVIGGGPAGLISAYFSAINGRDTVLIEKNDSTVINAKSIMGVITMAAGYNTVLTVKAEGSDAEDAVNAIYSLFENKFEEE